MKYLVEVVIDFNEEPNRLNWIPETFAELLEEGESLITWSCVPYTGD